MPGSTPQLHSVDVHSSLSHDTRLSRPETTKEPTFLRDVLKGLKSPQKSLSSKYFYDETGDRLFQRIMECDDYYLTRCEMEIFRDHSAELARTLNIHSGAFDLIELGAGDGTKTRHLLDYLHRQVDDFRYLPVEISGHILDVLTQNLDATLSDITVMPHQGDYFDALERICQTSDRRKVLLFLGSNIGNMTVEECSTFCQRLASMMSPGDMLITGFDLKKDPRTVLRAYDDSDGITREFNLNLLRRINEELHADFDLTGFEHYQTYDPGSGACRSYLISQREQTVNIGGQRILFLRHEPLFMEVSRKFSRRDIAELATESGFSQVAEVCDRKGWFMNAIWKRNA
ncbi:MAG: L-histidine N(alpha)-methyltransferase [Thalassolituus sp.]